MSGPDPVAVALESALTPTMAEATVEVDAWTKAMAAKTVNGWDFVSVGPAPDFPRLRLRSLRTLVEHAYATGEPCDGERCEDGGAAHCHRCAEAEADQLLRERDQLRAALAELLAGFPGAYLANPDGSPQWMSRSQWIETAKLDAWRALITHDEARRTLTNGET